MRRVARSKVREQLRMMAQECGPAISSDSTRKPGCLLENGEGLPELELTPDKADNLVLNQVKLS